MSAVTEHNAVSRHPWLAQFEKAPVSAFGDLLSGYAAIHPYERFDAPEAAKLLFWHLDLEDDARKALGPAVLRWLELRRAEELPTERPKLQRFIREICEALEISTLFQLSEVALDLRHQREDWAKWFDHLAQSPARDAKAEFLRTLACTQKLIAVIDPKIDFTELSSTWHELFYRAGKDLPDSYRSIATLGIRELSSFVSKCCDGESCYCGKPAKHKVEETIFPDDPLRNRHPLTAYVCEQHFREIMGATATYYQSRAAAADTGGNNI